MPESMLEILKKNKDKIDCGASTKETVAKLFDDDSFVELDAFVKANAVTGFGEIEGEPVFAFIQDGGAVTAAQAGKIKKLYEMAAKVGAPVVGVYDSNGADVSDPQLAMASYSDILAVANNLSGVVPQIAVVTGVCAGVAAMAACSADVVIMSRDAELFMTAPFTAKANGEEVEGAGTADHAVKAGVVQIVADSVDGAFAQARKIVSMLPINNLSMAPLSDFAPVENGAVLAQMCEDHAKGVCTKSVIEATFDAGSLVLLGEGYAECAVTGLGTLGGVTCGFVGTKGQLCADGSRKIARFVRLCDSFSIPVVTFVNCDGFVPSAAAELTGSIRDSALLAHSYAEATTAKVTVVVGDAIGAAYVALCKNDVVLAWPNAVISALKPETAVAFLWTEKLAGSSDPVSDRAALVEEYRSTTASAFAAAANGCVSDVIDPASTRNEVMKAIDMLNSKRVTNLPKKHGNMPL